MSRVLTCKNLGIDFGGLTAVNNLNLEIDENEIIIWNDEAELSDGMDVRCE